MDLDAYLASQAAAAARSPRGATGGAHARRHSRHVSVTSSSGAAAAPPGSHSRNASSSTALLERGSLAARPGSAAAAQRTAYQAAKSNLLSVPSSSRIDAPSVTDNAPQQRFPLRKAPTPDPVVGGSGKPAWSSSTSRIPTLAGSPRGTGHSRAQSAASASDFDPDQFAIMIHNNAAQSRGHSRAGSLASAAFSAAPSMQHQFRGSAAFAVPGVTSPPAPSNNGNGAGQQQPSFTLPSDATSGAGAGSAVPVPLWFSPSRTERGHVIPAGSDHVPSRPSPRAVPAEGWFDGREEWGVSSPSPSPPHHSTASTFEVPAARPAASSPQAVAALPGGANAFHSPVSAAWLGALRARSARIQGLAAPILAGSTSPEFDPARHGRPTSPFSPLRAHREKHLSNKQKTARHDDLARRRLRHAHDHDYPYARVVPGASHRLGEANLILSPTILRARAANGEVPDMLSTPGNSLPTSPDISPLQLQQQAKQQMKARQQQRSSSSARLTSPSPSHLPESLDTPLRSPSLLALHKATLRAGMTTAARGPMPAKETIAAPNVGSRPSGPVSLRQALLDEFRQGVREIEVAEASRTPLVLAPTLPPPGFIPAAFVPPPQQLLQQTHQPPQASTQYHPRSPQNTVMEHKYDDDPRAAAAVPASSSLQPAVQSPTKQLSHASIATSPMHFSTTPARQAPAATTETQAAWRSPALAPTTPLQHFQQQQHRDVQTSPYLAPPPPPRSTHASSPVKPFIPPPPPSAIGGAAVPASAARSVAARSPLPLQSQIQRQHEQPQQQTESDQHSAGDPTDEVEEKEVDLSARLAASLEGVRQLNSRANHAVTATAAAAMRSPRHQQQQQQQLHHHGGSNDSGPASGGPHVLDRVEKLLRIARQPLGFHVPPPLPPPPPQPQPQYFAKWQEQQQQLQQQAAALVSPYRPPAVPFASVQSPTDSLASYASMPTPAPLRVPLSEQRRFAHAAAVPAAASSSSQQQQPPQQQYELHDISELTHSRADESHSSNRIRQSSSQQQPSPHMDLNEAQLQHERFLLWQQRLHGGGGGGAPAPSSSPEQGSSSLPWQQHSDGVSTALANSLRNIQELRDSIRIGGIGNMAAALLPRTLNHTPPVHQAASETYAYPAVPPAVHPFLPPLGPASGADDGLVNLHFTLPPSSSTNVLVEGQQWLPAHDSEELMQLRLL